MSPRNVRAVLASGLSSINAAQDAATTIALRLPILVSAFVNPTLANTEEARLAVDEKFQAAFDGSVAMSFSWQRLCWDMAFGRASVASLPGKLLAIAESGARPARRRVRANARRLTQA